MRNWFLVALIVPSAIVISLLIGLLFPILAFRKKYPTIRNEGDLLAFKRLASIQMYGSLLALYLLGLPFFVWLAGKFAFGQLTWLDGLLFVILPFAAQVAISMAAIGTVRAVRNTPAEGELLVKERDRVVGVWLNQKFPER